MCLIYLGVGKDPSTPISTSSFRQHNKASRWPLRFGPEIHTKVANFEFELTWFDWNIMGECLKMRVPAFDCDYFERFCSDILFQSLSYIYSDWKVVGATQKIAGTAAPCTVSPFLAIWPS